MKPRLATYEEEDESRTRPSDFRLRRFIGATSDEIVYACGSWSMYAPVDGRVRWMWRGVLLARVEWVRA